MSPGDTAPVRRRRAVGLAAQDEVLTRRVGTIALIVLGAAIVFAIFVAPRIEWGDHVRIRVAFHHVGGLREGAPLIVGGRAVGRVESIALRGDDGVVVTAAVDAAVARRIPHDSDVFIASRGTLSERYLEFAPGPAARRGATAGGSLARAIADGDEFRGADPPSLDRVIERMWTNLTIAEAFGRAIRPELDALGRELARLDATYEQTLGGAPRVFGAGGAFADLVALRAEAHALREIGLGGDRVLAQLDALVARARATIARARGVLDSLAGPAGAFSDGVQALRARIRTRGAGAIERFELAIARARAAIDQIDPLLAKLADLRDRMERGEGSIGRLMRDPEFPEDAKELGKIIKRRPWTVIGRPPQ